MPAIFLACSAAVLVRIAMSAQTLPALQAAGLFAAGAIAYALWARRSPASAGG